MVEAANIGCFLNMLVRFIVVKGETYGKTKEKKKNRVEIAAYV